MLVEILRKYQGDMTQNEYARYLGLSSGHLSLIYSGRRGIGTEVLRAFLRAFPAAADEIGAALAAPAEEARVA
jgi:transcriptional regulator with XRE-family HTH domain